jgi:hypothetical protein
MGMLTYAVKKSAALNFQKTWKPVMRMKKVVQKTPQYER